MEVLSLHAIRSRLDELAATVAGTQRQAEEAHRLAEEAQKRAGHNAEVASRSIGAMDEISARGFAVVAAEVRSLSVRSAGAAKEIKDLVENRLRYVKQGETLVEASGEALAALMDTVKQVDALVAQIAAASQVQSRALAELSKALARL